MLTGCLIMIDNRQLSARNIVYVMTDKKFVVRGGIFSVSPRRRVLLCLL